MSILRVINDQTGNAVNKLQEKITYIKRESATDMDYVYGAGVSTLDPFNEMMLVKEAFGEADRKGFYHYTFNPEPGEDVLEEEFFDMGAEMAEHLSRFNGRYQVLMAVHFEEGKSNGKHLHFIANNVDVDTGQRMKLDKEDLFRLKSELSAIAEKYGVERIRRYEHQGQ